LLLPSPWGRGLFCSRAVKSRPSLLSPKRICRPADALCALTAVKCAVPILPGPVSLPFGAGPFSLPRSNSLETFAVGACANFHIIPRCGEPTPPASSATWHVRTGAMARIRYCAPASCRKTMRSRSRSSCSKEPRRNPGRVGAQPDVISRRGTSGCVLCYYPLVCERNKVRWMWLSCPLGSWPHRTGGERGYALFTHLPVSMEFCAVRRARVIG
jgi:hypothetical protein